MVRSQQSAKSLNANDLTPAALMLWLDDPVEALVNPLVMIVREIFGKDVAQLFFRGEDEVIKTLLLDGSDESLRVGV